MAAAYKTYVRKEEGKMKISIEYLRKHNKEPSKILLSPEEYYDPIEENETYENDAIPKHSMPDMYLEVGREELAWTKLSISGSSEDKEIFIRYFGNGDTWMSHRKDISGYEEIIHTVQENDYTCHIIRTNKESAGIWNMSYNGITFNLEDGSQKEVRFDRIT